MSPVLDNARGLMGAALCLVAACSPPPKEGGGIGGTGISSSVTTGPVTGFGSIFVSGYEHDTTKASFLVDGQPAGQNQLKIGMIVLVDGTITEDYGTSQPLVRVAHSVVYEDTVEGLVQSVSSDGLSLFVMGQSLRMTPETVVDPSVPGRDVRNLVAGVDVVEASGYVSGDGVILVSFVERKLGAPDYEVKGFVKNHRSSDKTFEVGALTVDYRSADIGQMPSSEGGGWNGLLVEVRGARVASGGPGSNGLQMTATRVEPEGLGVEDRGSAEIEGVVTQVIGVGDFHVGSVHVRTHAATEFERGTIEDLAVGVRVEVEGALVSNVLTADKVEFGDSITLQADVMTIDRRSDSEGTLALAAFPGISIQINSQTSFEGERDLKRFDDLSVGDRVKIRGRASGLQSVLATEVERTGVTSEIELQGPVQSASAPNLVVLGAAVDTTPIPDSRFRGRKQTIIGRAEFFRLLSEGVVVKFKGRFDTGVVIWREASLEGES